jgi:acetyl-CoA acetyltransferase
LRLNDIDLWELNEAFAVQVIYCRDRLGIDPEKLNPIQRNGGDPVGHVVQRFLIWHSEPDYIQWQPC